MSTLPTFSTNDLRSHSIDYKRDHEQKKWAYGITYGPGTSTEHGKPVRPGAKVGTAKLHGKPKRGEQAAKQAQRNDIMAEKFNVSDSSADEDVVSPLAAPTPNSDIFFSFDAPKGPSHGSQILNAALAKAIDKFESKATDKIVKDEYDVLDTDGEVVPPMPLPRGNKKGRKIDHLVPVPVIAEDDDYEFV